MNDLEENVTRRFSASALALDITPPPASLIVERVARRRRRRLAVRSAAGVGTAMLIIGGLVLIAERGDGTLPSASEIESQPADNTSTEVLPATTGPAATAPSITLNVTNTTAVADQWSRLPDNDLTTRSEGLAVATDSGLFVWGGYSDQSNETDGAYFDDATQAWRALPPAPLATDRSDALGVWTGTEVVVINGSSGNVTSAAFNPTTFTWRTLSDPPVDNAANGISQAAFIDGTVLLFSIDEDGAAPQKVARLDDLQGGHWKIVPSPPVSMVASSVGIVAAGSEAIVLGRTNTATGCNALHLLAYSPSDNSWRELPAGPVADRIDPVIVWTGSELFVGGGQSCKNGVATAEYNRQASLFDPTTQVWREASQPPDGFYSSYRYADIWTGTSVAILTPDGAPLLYNPSTDTWHLGPEINATDPIAPNQTPIVVANNSIIVSGGRYIHGQQVFPFRGTYAYTLPDGF